MASFTHLEWLRLRFRDPSAVLSTKLGSTLLRKPIATVSLYRQRTSRRQRARHLHGLVNGDVYGSRILIATPTALSHVRAIYILGAGARGDNRTCTYFRICARACEVSRMNGAARIYGSRVRPTHLLLIACYIAPPTYFLLAYGPHAQCR